MSMYSVIDDFAFSKSLPSNPYDTILINNVEVNDRNSVLHYLPYHDIEKYVKYINDKKIKNAIIFTSDILYLPRCPSLQMIRIMSSWNSLKDFDFSPLYDMPNVKYILCQNKYGPQKQHVRDIDYSKIKGLISLSLEVNNGTLNFNKVETLKSLCIRGFKGKNGDLTDLFCSKELDTLDLIRSTVRSLNGIDKSKKMQCLYLRYNRNLSDISALRDVKNSLRALEIQNCAKIKDFSVLGELDNLQLLRLSGSNNLPNLDFIKSMKNLKTFTCEMNVVDGNLTPCLNLSYVYFQNRKHYNLKDKELPKGEYFRGNENIEPERRYP